MDGKKALTKEDLEKVTGGDGDWVQRHPKGPDLSELLKIRCTNCNSDDTEPYGTTIPYNQVHCKACGNIFNLADLP